MKNKNLGKFSKSADEQPQLKIGRFSKSSHAAPQIKFSMKPAHNRRKKLLNLTRKQEVCTRRNL